MRSRNPWRPPADGGPVTRDIIMGVLSLILWSLVLVVTLKYVFILLRADNKGEGGTLTLVALAQRAIGKRRGRGADARASWVPACSTAMPS